MWMKKLFQELNYDGIPYILDELYAITCWAGDFDLLKHLAKVYSQYWIYLSTFSLNNSVEWRKAIKAL